MPCSSYNIFSYKGKQHATHVKLTPSCLVCLCFLHPDIVLNTLSHAPQWCHEDLSPGVSGWSCHLWIAKAPFNRNALAHTKHWCFFTLLSTLHTSRSSRSFHFMPATYSHWGHFMLLWMPCFSCICFCTWTFESDPYVLPSFPKVHSLTLQ